LSTLKALGNAQRRNDRSFRADVPAWQETHIGEGSSELFDPPSAEVPQEVYSQADYDWTPAELGHEPETQHPRRGRRPWEGSRRQAGD
jgi:hypothetical protein